MGVWFQDAGAAFLVEGLPQSGVTRVWMKNTGISEPMQSRIHRCCVENALRRLAADDPTLSALHWFGTPTHDTAAERRGVAGLRLRLQLRLRWFLFPSCHSGLLRMLASLLAFD